METSKLQKRLIAAAKTDAKRVHITPRVKGWAVRKEANLHPARVLPTQKEAIKFARAWVAAGKVSEVVIHHKNGSSKTLHDRTRRNELNARYEVFLRT